MNANRQTIAVVYPGPIPATNVITADFIEKRFSEYRVERIDLQEHLKAEHLDYFKVLLDAIAHYGLDIVSRKRRIRETLIRTGAINQIVKNAISKRKIKDLAFTFQMQSLFDASMDGIPHFLYTDHTALANLHYPIVDKDRLEKPSFIGREKAIYRNALSFTWSENIKKSIIEDYGIPPDRVIAALTAPNVSLNRAAPTVSEATRQNTILFVGVDWKRKGGPDLIDAFIRVASDRPNARLRIVGTSPDIKHPQITVVGRVPMDLVAQEYANASVFCLPTYVEPFGIAFLDAMSQSAAIIGTDIGAIPEIVVHEKTGLIVQPNDPRGLAHALSKMLDHPMQTALMGEAGRARLLEFFNWGAVADRIEFGVRTELERWRSQVTHPWSRREFLG